MKEKIYIIDIANCNIPCRFLFEKTKDHFRNYYREEDRLQNAIEVCQNDLNQVRHLYPENMTDDVLEYNELTYEISEKIIGMNRCIFHGLAFIWRGKAWIFTGNSGVGKTTQYVRWKQVFGNEIKLLNGDKPVLEFCENGQIMVHSSPWRGKENIGTNEKAVLGGIICLKKDNLNKLVKMEKKDAVKFLFLQFIFQGKKTDTIKRNRSFRR